MARLAAAGLAALALGVVVSGQVLQKPRFFPPRLKIVDHAPDLPPLPSPNVAGGGEVIMEALVDRRGAVLRPAIIRGTPPYTQFVLDAVARWRFDPARDIDYKGFETTVDVPVAIVALYRPPVLMNAPTIGEPPKDWSRPSGDAPYPVATAMPNYPPNARDGGVVLFELSLDEAGAVQNIRGLGPASGFESASREALAGFRFKSGMYRARPVPSTVYVLFGFRPPVGLPAVAPHMPNPGASMLPAPSGIVSFR